MTSAVCYEYRFLPDRACVAMDPSVEVLVGYAAGEFLDQPALLFDIVHPQDRALYFKLLAGDISVARLRLVARDGSSVWSKHKVTRVLEADRLVRVIGQIQPTEPPPGHCGRYSPVCIRILEGLEDAEG